MSAERPLPTNGMEILKDVVTGFRETIWPAEVQLAPDLLAGEAAQILQRSIESHLARSMFGTGIFDAATLPHQLERAEAAEQALGYKPLKPVDFRNLDQLHGIRVAGVEISRKQAAYFSQFQENVTAHLTGDLRRMKDELDQRETGSKSGQVFDLSQHPHLAPPRERDTLGRIPGRQPPREDEFGQHTADED